MRGNLQYSHTVQKKYIMRVLSKLSIYALIEFAYILVKTSDQT